MAVSVEAVAAVLAHTLSDDANIRNGAEAELDKLKDIAGGTGCLLEVVSIPAVDFMTRLAGVVRLKNLITAHWTKQDGTIPEQDRKVVRDNLLKTIIVCVEPQLRSQLLESIYTIAKTDFPANWPTLLGELMAHFQQQDLGRLYAALCALRMLFKKYQYKGDDASTTECGEFVRMVFPTLHNLYTALTPVESVEAYHMLYQLGKIFNYSVQMHLPPYLRADATMTQWMGAFLAIINKNPPPALAAEFAQPNFSRQALQTHPFWRAKKWAFRCVSRMMVRYGRTKVTEDPEEKQFAAYWANKFGQPMLVAFINQLKVRRAGGRVSDPVVNLVHEYVDLCVDIASYYQTIKKELSFVLVDSVLDTLMLSEADIQEQIENPQQACTVSSDFVMEFKDPKTRAANVTYKLVKTRTRDCLMVVTKSITDILNVYAQTPPEHRNYLLKEAALNLFSSLQRLLLKRQDFLQPVEELLVTHVFPEFRSPHGYLRARACEVVGAFKNLEYMDEKHTQFVLEAVVNALSDPLLHVKLSASRALTALIDGAEVVEFLKPHVPKILDEFFVLYDEIGGEEVVCVLSDLIALIGPEAAPFAEKMASKFIQSFFELRQADEDDDDAGALAARCLQALTSLLCACEGVPNLFPRLEQMCQPVLLDMLKPDGLDALDDALEMMTCFTFFCSEISPFMWSLLPRFVECFHTFASDSIKNMLPAFENYIRSTDTFLGSQDPNYLQLVTSCGVSLLRLEETRDNEGTYGCRLLELILSYCKGRVDQIVPGIIEMAAAKLQHQRPENTYPVSLEMKLACCDLLGACADYNPELFHATCNQLGPDWTQNLFNHWLSHLPHMEKSLRHQKMSLIGLASLFRAPLDRAQQRLAAAYPTVLCELIALAELNVNTSQARIAARGGRDEDDTDGDDDDEDDDDFEDIAEHLDHDDGHESIEAYTKKLSAEMQERRMHESFGIYNIKENEFPTATDKIECLSYFLAALQLLGDTNQAFYDQWTASLSVAQRQSLAKIVAEAEVRQAKRAEKEAKKAADIQAEAQKQFAAERGGAAAGGP